MIVHGYLERQMPQIHMSLISPSFPEFLVLFTMLYGMEYPLQQLGTAILAISPPSLLLTSSLPVGDEDRRERKS